MSLKPREKCFNIWQCRNIYWEQFQWNAETSSQIRIMFKLRLFFFKKLVEKKRVKMIFQGRLGVKTFYKHERKLSAFITLGKEKIRRGWRYRYKEIINEGDQTGQRVDTIESMERVVALIGKQDNHPLNLKVECVDLLSRWEQLRLMASIFLMKQVGIFSS